MKDLDRDVDDKPYVFGLQQVRSSGFQIPLELVPELRISLVRRVIFDGRPIAFHHTAAVTLLIVARAYKALRHRDTDQSPGAA
jgi:hypothetical protein